MKKQGLQHFCVCFLSSGNGRTTGKIHILVKRELQEEKTEKTIAYIKLKDLSVYVVFYGF